MDRNLAVWAVEHAYQLSLSARRAWIEMQGAYFGHKMSSVALRKESVDRNTLFLSFLLAVGSSLSARRAWIEMTITICTA